MLASADEERAALRTSLATEIVELVVLTGDDLFLQTLREAVGAARRLWHVPTALRVSDLLIAGGVGILVLDVQRLEDSASVFISQIKRQFPDLVVVAAGPREAETSLAPLISDGTIYRFIHKPMSPGRARLFADAAVKRYDEQRKRTPIASVTAIPTPSSRRLLIGTASALAVIIALIGFANRGGHGEKESRAGLASLRPQSPLLSRGAQALAANRLTAPAGDNALEFYLRQLAQNPEDADARTGLAEVHERLLARAENALLEERLDETAAAIETARKAGVESGRIAFLTTELAKARELHKLSAAPKAKDAGAPAAYPSEPPAAAEISAVAARASTARTKMPAAGTSATTLAPPLAAPPLAAPPLAAPPLAAPPLAALPLAAPPLAAPPQAAPPQAANPAEQAASLATERIIEGHLLEPEHDNARYYVQEALRADPNDAAAHEAEQSLALALQGAVRSAIDRRDFAEARSLLDAAAGIASPANIENLQRSLAAARREADL